MSTPKRIFTLSIGSQTVSLAEFRSGAQRGSLVLHAFDSRELMADPAADATRVSQASLLLGEMVGVMKAKQQSVRLTLPAQATFSRMLKVPAMGGTQLAETVAHEAKQNIPYPLEEVVWDYRIVFETEEHDPEVLIAAAKKDVLEDWTSMVQGSALHPSGIELSNVALYNAFRYNYGEPEGCSLLIDLGARTTNLIFIEPGKFFLRTISSGGSNLTTAVAKEFGETFFVAEGKKVRDGFVGLGSNFAEPESPEVAKLAKTLRNAATRLHAEVARSVSFYRSQQGGGAPQRIFLSGGGATMQMMREFWEEKMGVPVELFNPLRCIGVSKGADAIALAGAAPFLGEHVGVALQAALQCPVSINLLPPAVNRKKVISQYAIVVGLATACLCAPAVAWGFHLRRSAEIAAKQADGLVKEIEEAKKWDKEIKATREKISSLFEKAAPLEKAATDRRYWITLLESIHSCLPKELVWVTNLELIKPTPPAPGSPTPAQPSASDSSGSGAVRLMLKGFYLENPKGIEVVDEFGLSLTFKAALDAALQENSNGGKKLSEDDLALIKAQQIKKIKEECERFKWNEDTIEAFCDRLKSLSFPDSSTSFKVAPIQDWIRPTTPSPTDWAQEFAIPLDLLTPPVTFTQPTQ